jgi:hypothetical protein
LTRVCGYPVILRDSVGQQAGPYCHAATYDTVVQNGSEKFSPKASCSSAEKMRDMLNRMPCCRRGSWERRSLD